MESTFEFLNLRYLRSQIEESDNDEFNWANEVPQFDNLIERGQTPEDILELRARDLTCYNYKKFCFHLCAFYDIATRKFGRFKNEVAAIATYFENFNLEELCLYYLEVYFWNCLKGRHYFVKMFQERLFQKNVNIIFKADEYLFNSFREYKKTILRTQLEEHLRKLKMSKVTLRKSRKYQKLLFHC